MQDGVLATGSCNCRAIKFSVTAPLSDVFVCHCSICRKSTGGGGVAVTIAPKSSITIFCGEDLVQSWKKPNHDWSTNFCKICGSPLPGDNDEQNLFIPVSLLDSGHDQLSIKHHIFVDSKACWEEIGMIGKHHKEAFSG